ncbi:family 43 glycosylhydrolase [Actinomyces faecalis]|uniref:family 43 glycosylhydrolase n=1 Tax=Actinomyces faecalis TaxID=2722820 RepID=UPI0015563E2A|nr:family 43 glycosylhydrolase [Actinomyces faecalis]
MSTTPAWGHSIENQRRANLGDGTYRNPVMGGDYPDPTVLRVGERYYLTFSSFESSPALVLWRSDNLVDWEPVGHACPEPWGSVFATDLVEHEGRFYMYIPFMPTSWSTVDAPTIAVMWADDIEGEWHGPVDLGLRGYIDPGHAVGEDGQRYLFLNGVDRVRLSDDGLATAGPVEHVYDGWHYPEDWVVEAYSLEGPKHVVRDGWHYLVSAVGGTAGPATSHMIIVARSRSIDGPWENMPTNPLVRCTDPAQPWWSRGHGTLLEGPGGQWYVVYHAYENGAQGLGRQILLEPVDWTDDGWPVARGGDLRKPLPLPGGGREQRPHGFALSDDFTRLAWGWRWTFDQPGADETERAVLTDGGLLLAGKGTDPSTSSPMTLRAPDRSYRVETSVSLVDGSSTTAGLLLFFNHRLFLGLELAPGRLQAWTGGTRTWGHERLEEPVTALDLAIVKREHVVDMYYRPIGAEEWAHYPLTLECSGYHANTANDLVSLRPALFAAGDGHARFSHVTYRAL